MKGDCKEVKELNEEGKRELCELLKTDPEAYFNLFRPDPENYKKFCKEMEELHEELGIA